MQNFQIEVLPNHNPHMIRIKPEDQQRAVYADCVIFADAGFVSELIWRCTIVFEVSQNGIHLIGSSVSCCKMSAASSADVSSRRLPTTSTTEAVATHGRVSANSRRRPNGAMATPARVPDDTCVYAIGDIDGYARLLRKIHGVICDYG